MAAILTVNTAPTITTPPANVTVCAPSGTSFDVTATNALTYQWQVSTDGGVTWNNVVNGGVYGGATTATLNISNTTGLNGNQYRCVVGGGPSCVPAISVAAILTVNAAPVITTQPANTAICVPPAGSGTVGTSFNVTATNATSYQWQVSTDGGVTWNNIVNGGVYGGATTSTLTISDGTGLNGYQYRCIVDGQTLCSPATSAAATLTVNNAPVITTPPANVTICAPSGASFTVVAANGLTYQWQVSTDAGVTWNNVVNGGVYSGATTATLNISNATGFNAYQYRVIVGGAALCAPETSVAAILTVNTAPAITSQPADATICVPPAGSGTVGTSFSVTATNAISYQWQVSTDGGATWNNVVNGGVYSGATSSTLIITDGTGFNGYQYRCIVDGAAPCASTTSDPAILTVNNAPVITTPPADVTVCAPSGASFTVAATNGLTYQWQLSTDGGVTWNNIVNGGVYSGATTSDLNISNSTGLNANQYRCVVGGNASCAPAISVAAILTVNTASAITSQPVDATICVPPAGSGTVGTSFSVTATNATSYQWQVSTDGGATWNNVVNGGVYSSATSSTLIITDGTGLNGYQYRCIVDGAAPCAAATSAAATLTVNNAPVITTPPADVTICAPSGASFTVAATNGLTYQWQVSTDA